MLECFKTVYRGGEAEIVEKKSRFIGTVRPVESEEEAFAFLEEMRKKYWDATHNCFAFVAGNGGNGSGPRMTESLPEPRGGLCWMCCWGRTCTTRRWW